MNKYYNSKPNNPLPCPPDTFFNSNSSISYFYENSLKPKYFDRMGSKKFDNNQTTSDLDFPNNLLDHEIINSSNNRFNDTYNNDLTMLNALNMINRNLLENNQNNSKSPRSFSEPQNYRNLCRGGQKLTMNNNSKFYKEAQLNNKMREINQLLGNLIVLTEQKKMDLIRKTSHLTNKDRNSSFITGKASSSRLDHANLKFLAKIKKDSSIFDIDNSEDSDEETNVNNIFNNNMSYLNSTINGACPGGLLKNYSNVNYSLPANIESSDSINYNNKSAGAALGGYYIKTQTKFLSTNKNNNMEFNKTTITAASSDRRKIFEKNKSTLTSDSKNNISSSNDDLCMECLSYFDKISFGMHQKNCRRKVDNNMNNKKTSDRRKF